MAIKIAIAGAAGAGKTKFARKLKVALTEAEICTPHIVDKYVERLGRRTGWAYGHFAGYVLELQIMSERIVAEQEAMKTHADIITCGTIFETLCYAALHGRVATTKIEEQLEFARMRATMQTLALTINDTFNADYTFYIPYTARKAAKEDGWDGVINAKLPEIIESYFVPAVRLDKSEEDNVKLATTIIKEWEAEKQHQDEAAKTEQ